MKKKELKGISLIVLVITIIVIIILAGAFILNLTKNNPMDNAKKAAYLSDLDSFRSDLSMYESKQYSDNIGDYDATQLQADEASVTYKGNADTTKTISDVIESLKSNTKYIGQLEVVDGELTVKVNDTKKRDWAIGAGYKVLIPDEPKVTIELPSTNIVKSGTNVVYTIKFSSTEALATIDLTNKLVVMDSENTELTTQPTITVGTVSGTSTDILRQVDITIDTTDLTEGSYKLKVKSGSVTTSDNMSNTQDSISLVGFDIDTTAPENPTIVATPTTLTNGNVTVTCNYSEDTKVEEYSTDGTTWSNYTAPIVVTTNNTTVYSRGKDIAGNISGQATLTVSNIDKALPTVAFATNGGSGETASTTVTVSDASGINASTLQCVWDTQNTTTPVSGWMAFTNGATLTKTGEVGTYYLWIKASDNAGNVVFSKTNSFVLTPPVVANTPVLSSGMIAKKWDGSSWVTVTNPDTDTSWYNYSNKQWANAQTADGSMWVWIPRYEYKIPTPHSRTAQTIAVNFLSGTSVTATSGYIVHPAFTFGTTELTGIWVAKFEASGTTSTVASKPNVTPLANIIVDAMFTACRNMETTYGAQYGWGTSGIGLDTHLMKNVEWGAVAYLSSSAYGKTGEVWINPYYNTSTTYSLTGQAGTSESESYTTTTYSYDNLTYGVNASTTGNIYGIYDMSGGSAEYTAAYVNNGAASLTTVASSLINAASQYKDVYTPNGDSQSGNYSEASSKKGDAVYETSFSGTGSSSWYGDYSFMPYTGNALFIRGNHAAYTTGAGIFAFNCNANRSTNYGFRPCVAVDASL